MPKGMWVLVEAMNIDETTKKNHNEKKRGPWAEPWDISIFIGCLNMDGLKRDGVKVAREMAGKPNNWVIKAKESYCFQKKR